MTRRLAGKLAILLALSPFVARQLAADDEPAASPDVPAVSREETALRIKIEKALGKGKGDLYAIGVSETTFHTDVERTYFKTVKQKGEPAKLEEVKEFKTGGEFFPVPKVEFRVIDGADAALTHILEHMKKFPAPVKKKARGKKQQDAGPPPPVGDWTFIGRFSDPMKAEGAIKQAQDQFDASGSWKVAEKAGK